MKKYIFIFIVLFCLPCFCSAEKVIEFTPVNDYGYSETYTAYEALEHENLYVVRFDLHKAMNITLSNCGSAGMTAAAMSLTSDAGSISLSPQACGTAAGIGETTLFLSAGSYSWQVRVTAQTPGWILQLSVDGAEYIPGPSSEDPVELGVFLTDQEEVILDKATSGYPPLEGAGGAVLHFFETVCPTDITFNVTDSDTRLIVKDRGGLEVFRTEGRPATYRFPQGKFCLYVDFISGKDGDLDMSFSVRLIDSQDTPADTLLAFPTFARTELPVLSDRKNYVLTHTALSADGKQYRDVAQYLDGLGRTSLLLEKNVTPAGKSLFSLQEYDGNGRPYKKWLQVDASGNHIGRAEVVSAASRLYNGDSRAYELTEYEPSPLDRVTSKYGPGTAWQNHPASTVYAVNGNTPDLRCSYYYLNGTALARQGDYAPGELTVTKSVDEDGHVLFTFKDKEGRTVLSRQLNGTERNDTYYIYDRHGNPVYVLPPMIADNISGASLEQYAYSYKYDEWNRCIERKMPGAGNLTRFAYDKADRLVFQQDGVQAGRNEWSATLYDALGREVLKGLCTISSRPSVENVVLKAVRVEEGGIAESGYAVEGFSYSLSRLLRVNYYDDYTFLNLAPHQAVKDGLLYGFSDVAGSSVYDKRYVKYGIPAISSQGLLTGTKVYPADGGSGLLSAFYYDGLGNVVQQRSQNHLDGYEKDFFSYTFSGKPLKHLHIHSAPGKDDIREVYSYVYDNKTGDNPERLLKVQHQLDGGNVITLVENVYDELGRVKNRKLHNGVSGTEYAYNIRSWMTDIKNGHFNQTLHYADGVGSACYNGNIGSMTWQAGNESTVRGYKFTYDGMNRLVAAAYGETAGIGTNVDRFSERVTGYDKNGNIKGLQRYGQTSAGTYGMIDNLTFTFDGNRLSRVDDSATASAYNNGFEFKDAVKQANEYAYDANGNLTKDLNKGISNMSYNCLNLPSAVTFSDGSTVTYTYAADGTKLKTVHKIGAATTTTDYCGNVIYENGLQKLLLTEAGYVTLNDKKYHYYLKDHQGNNRVVINQSGAVEETNHYYPLGGVFASTNNVQPYKYNGKELDAKKGLNWYDYGARMYDAALGCFVTVDPLAEKYYSISQYGYCGNNPIKYIDPTGMFYTGFTIDEKGYIQKVNNEGGDKYDVIYNKSKYSSQTRKDYDTSGDKTGIKISKGILNEQAGSKNMSDKTISGPINDPEGHKIGEYANHSYEVKSDKEALSLMNFMDKNTNVEWGNTLMKDMQGNLINLLSTSHDVNTIKVGSFQVNKYIRRGFQIIRADHIHPAPGAKASEGDKDDAENIRKRFPNATFRILNAGKYYPY